MRCRSVRLAPLFDKEVVFSTQPSGQASQLWLAPLDRSSPPKLIASSNETSPHFGPDGDLVFQMRDGKANYLARMKRDGSDRSKVMPDPISGIYGGISPDRRWVAASIPAPDVSTGAIMAVPTDGGALRRICQGFRPVAWAPDGKFFTLGSRAAHATGSGKRSRFHYHRAKRSLTCQRRESAGWTMQTPSPAARLIDCGRVPLRKQ